jgi:hypothetical protein
MKSKKFLNCLKKNFFNLKVKLHIENTISRPNKKNAPQPFTKEKEIIENPSSVEFLDTSRIHNKEQLSKMNNLKY